MSSVTNTAATGVGSMALVPTSSSAVDWGAILAGAMAAAMLSLMLLVLGGGLGFSALSPWARTSISASTIGISAILWLCFMQIASASVGGYIAGRLRARWTQFPADEVHFRDSAHGFLAWAVATLATAILLTTVTSSVISGGLRVAGKGMSAAGAIGLAETHHKSSSRDDSAGYFVDALFRPNENGDMPTPNSEIQSAPIMAAPHGERHDREIVRIFARTIKTGALSAADTQYIARLVTQNTDLTQQQAEQRVTDVYGRMQSEARELEAAARDAAEKTRRGLVDAALWNTVSLLLGAFIASFMAILGGRLRDDQP